MPTVRGAELLGGNRMPNKRMPVVERRQETHGDMLGPSVERRRDNWPDMNFPRFAGDFRTRFDLYQTVEGSFGGSTQEVPR
jgi:hypothetical protein